MTRLWLFNSDVGNFFFFLEFVLMTSRSLLTLFFFRVVMLGGCANSLNDWAHDNWESFATQNYFRQSGSFLALLYSTPIICNSFVILINMVVEISGLLIFVKREELKRAKRKKDKTNKAATESESETTTATVTIAKKSNKLKQKWNQHQRGRRKRKQFFYFSSGFVVSAGDDESDSASLPANSFNRNRSSKAAVAKALWGDNITTCGVFAVLAPTFAFPLLPMVWLWLMLSVATVAHVSTRWSCLGRPTVAPHGVEWAPEKTTKKQNCRWHRQSNQWSDCVLHSQQRMVGARIRAAVSTYAKIADKSTPQRDRKVWATNALERSPARRRQCETTQSTQEEFSGV